MTRKEANSRPGLTPPLNTWAENGKRVLKRKGEWMLERQTAEVQAKDKVSVY
jgi:hypothetical protein